MNSVYSVGQVNSYIKNMFRQDILLTDISVSGEVSNCKFHRSGHVYFTLKDKDAAISCVMFAGNRQGLTFSMRDGDNVIVSGYIDVYEKTGAYQLYARKIKPNGSGALYEKFLRLKEELADMGMFDPSYKQPVPSFPKRVGVVTSPTGAAIRDIENVLKRRNPGVEIILYPALVQGNGAAESIVKGIAVLDALSCDVLIVGRGGGSIEDLWAFNEEAVARAIFDCRTPVISAVGHETDFTISDFTADLRAPTPSAAAELASRDVKELIHRLASLSDRLDFISGNRLLIEKRRLSLLEKTLAANSPENRFSRIKDRLLLLSERLSGAAALQLKDKKNRLSISAERLQALSPLKKLAGGFAFVETAGKVPVYETGDVKKDDRLFVHVKDGIITALVEEIHKA